MEALQMCQSTTPRYQWLSQVTCMQGSHEAEAEDAGCWSPTSQLSLFEASTQIFSPSPWLWADVFTFNDETLSPRPGCKKELDLT